MTRLLFVITLAVILPLYAAPCRVDLAPPPVSGEGMWPWRDLASLDEGALQARGLEIPLGSLWSPEGGGLFQAVAGLRGCSASFVSADGLLLTNHHCAYGALQRNSSPENNVVADGFLAAQREDELRAYGSVVFVFLRQTDVSEQILADLPQGLADAALVRELERRESALIAACEETPNRRCDISRENDGLRFALLENLEVRDLRVVAAPPASLGHFGGEIDNWHWPRHTLDFALLRAYVAPDGSVAEFSTENVPYKPARFLRVADQALKPGDLVMVAGKPGRTSRYETSASVGDALQRLYPLREATFQGWIDALERATRDRSEAAIKTSTWIKGLSNALFNAKGMLIGLVRNRVQERAREREEGWRRWVAQDQQREKRWGRALDALLEWQRADFPSRDRDFLLHYMLRGSQIFSFARLISKWALEQAKPALERSPGYQERDRADHIQRLDQAERSLDPAADKAVMAFFLLRLCQLGPSQRLAHFDEQIGASCSEASVARYVDDLYARTTLLTKEGRLALFGASADRLARSKDSAIALALALSDDLDAFEQRERGRQGAGFRLGRPWLESLLAYQGAQFYPDANGSPRVSFAAVAGYVPRDGVWHSPFTSMEGLRAKVTGADPFEAPEAVVKAIEAKRVGPWADPRSGRVTLNVLSNADTTGGNSGSPVLNGRGELVGLNFDRVYENIAGDWGYTRERSRNIFVSSQAILWFLDVVLDARALLVELGQAPESKSP